MKKRLEADLISIAHRILQLKNKSDINQLYLETQKLYEKLAVLRFVETHFGGSQPTIGLSETSQKIEAAFEAAENEIPTAEKVQIPATDSSDNEQPKQTTTERTEDEEEQSAITEREEVVFEDREDLEDLDQEEAAIDPPFIPAFELEEEEETIKAAPKQEAVQISFEDLMGADFSEDLFVKVETNAFESPVEEETEKAVESVPFELEAIALPGLAAETPKSVSLNEKLGKGIQIDLNDRIAFTKHLFGNDPEDYNRVLNQLITFDTFYETRDFIRDMVKPDYNNWEGKEEYEERFMEIIEKKFL